MRLLKAAGLFVIMYLMFRAMSIFLHVRMTGWQFIVFTLVLAAIAAYFLDHHRA